MNQALSVQAVCCLTGTTGTGKTQIALEYAHRFEDHYSEVLWVTNPTTMLLDVIENTGEEDFSMGGRDSSNREVRKRLVVLDNVEGGLEIKFLLYKWDLSRASILITTQQREFATPAGVLWYRMEIYPLTFHALAIEGKNPDKFGQLPENTTPIDSKRPQAEMDSALRPGEHQPQKRIKLEEDRMMTQVTNSALYSSHPALTNPTLLISNLVNSYIQQDKNPQEPAVLGDSVISKFVDATEERQPGSKKQGRKRTKTGCLSKFILSMIVASWVETDE
jgi:hypothetical protein